MEIIKRFASVFGLCGKLLVAEAAGATSERRPGAASCWTQPAPAEPALTKTEPISDTGGTSVKTSLRKGLKNTVQQLGTEREMQETTKVRKKRRGRRCAGHQSRDSAIAHRDDHGEAGCPLQPVQKHVRADIHTAAPGGPHAPKGSCSLWKVHTGAGENCEERRGGRHVVG